ncbi:hypothetical protein IEQ34_021944 [Dendrobium chrysotoxum]|uniref:Aquaporin n=1 Tax=Dendrobium chrysotoxum TaxID=161865 RepID=A0AAV7FXK8_DENCH|nr:hypothetical protein IEQ34_021944 [Dendrobium chrysotoxum]
MHRMGAIKSAICDAVITFLWVFSVSTIGSCTQPPHYHLSNRRPRFFFFFYHRSRPRRCQFQSYWHRRLLRGWHRRRLSHLTGRPLPFSGRWGGGGVLAIVEFMPSQYKHMLGGPSVKVDLHTAAIAEGLLTFLISFAVLWIVIKGPRSMVVKSLMVAVTTVTLVVSGSGYTGPAMNPANGYKQELRKCKSASSFSILQLLAFQWNERPLVSLNDDNMI